MSFTVPLTSVDDVARFGVEQSKSSQLRAQPGFPQGPDLLGRVGLGE